MRERGRDREIEREIEWIWREIMLILRGWKISNNSGMCRPHIQKPSKVNKE